MASASVAHLNYSIDAGALPARKRKSDIEADTAVVVREVMLYVIHEEGVEIPRCSNCFAPKADEPQLLKPVDVLKGMSKSMLMEYGSEMRCLCSNLDVSDEHFYVTYRTVVENTLGSDLNWGRIVSLMTFTGLLAAFLIQRGQERKVESLLGWQKLYINDRCHAWLEKHGGWVSIFFLNPSLWGCTVHRCAAEA